MKNATVAEEGMPQSVLEALKSEKRGRISGGLYHRLQIDITYNSNHIEGSRLTHEQTRWIFETKTIGNVGPDVPVDDIIPKARFEGDGECCMALRATTVVWFYAVHSFAEAR